MSGRTSRSKYYAWPVRQDDPSPHPAPPPSRGRGSCCTPRNVDSALKPSPLMGEGWVGVSAPDCAFDCHEYALLGRQNIVVGKANDPIALPLDRRRARRIDLWIMLASIHLDDQPPSMARKVGNVLEQRYLSTKPCFRKILAQQGPHPVLGIGHVAPQSPCQFGGGCRWMMFHRQHPDGRSPPPQPSPIKGEGVGQCNGNR